MTTSRTISGITATLLLLAAGPAAFGGQIGLRWEPVSGASGYRVYYGPAAGQYNRMLDVGPSVHAVLSGLTDCTDHYLTVKAYNGAGESQAYSNEVHGWPRPEVVSHSPSAVLQGSQLTMNIQGKNFQTGATLALDTSSFPRDNEGEPLVHIESVSVLSCQQIQALVTVEPTARGFRAMEVGDFTLQFEVTNPDNVYGSGPLELEVQFNQARLDINRADGDTRERVDGKDLVWLAYAHGAEDGQERYSADADLNGDGTVDGEDLAYLAAGFGACWTGSGWTAGACR